MIGPPRTGSTLVTQLIVNNFKVSTFTNLHCQWRRVPWIAEFIRTFVYRNRRVHYDSQFGKTEEKWAPSECPSFWYQFYPRFPSRITEQNINAINHRALVRSIGILGQLDQRVPILKNLINSMRIASLAQAFPQSIFLWTTRNEKSMIPSILQARRANVGTIQKWWSIRPDEFHNWKNLLPEEQVQRQVASVQKVILEDLERSSISSARVLKVQYEHVSADPDRFLKSAELFLKRIGVSPRERNGTWDTEGVGTLKEVIDP